MATQAPTKEHQNLSHKTAVTSPIEEALRRREDGAPPLCFFDRRLKSHGAMAGASRRGRLAPPEAQAALEEVLSYPSQTKHRSLYVHIPFCEHICSFCAFHRRPASAWEFLSYAEAVRGQITRLAETPYARAVPLESVYIGGGTPTALPREVLCAILDDIRTKLPLAPDCEVTVETRCSDIADGYLRALRDAGVNRLSVGVQTFHTDIRCGVNRQRSGEEALQSVHHAVDTGFRVVSLDLMYNLPGQSLRAWQKDLETALSLPISAASAYALIPMERSALARRVAAGAELQPGGTDREWDCYLAAMDAFATAHGWRQYSPVHYGRVGFERNRYNGVRAMDVDILAIGSGAGGRIGSLEYMNPPDVKGYVAAWEKDTPGEVMGAWRKEQPPAARAVRELFERLSVSEEKLANAGNVLIPLLDACVKLNALEQRDGTWRLLPAGRFWAYNLCAAMLSRLESERR